jgi:GAF domain-containing protein
VVAPLRWEGRLIGLLGLSYLEDQAPFGQETLGLVGVSARLAELILEREQIVAQREEARATAGRDRAWLMTSIPSNGSR